MLRELNPDREADLDHPALNGKTAGLLVMQKRWGADAEAGPKSGPAACGILDQQITFTELLIIKAVIPPQVRARLPRVGLGPFTLGSILVDE